MITTPEQMREAAIAACKKVADEAKRYGIPQMTMGANICYDAIRAIPIAPQHVTDWTACAADMLRVWDEWFGGSADSDHAAADRLAIASAFAAQAFEHAASSGITADGAPAALLRAFLLALIEPLHPDLDYLRADPSAGEKARDERGVVAPPVAAAPQPMAVTVKPLVWERGIVDMARPQPGMKYVACSTTPRGCWAWWLEGAENTRNVERDEATAKAAAQADYEARILSALTIQPADPLSDQRVVALVEALEYIMDGYGLNPPEFKQTEYDEDGELVADDWIVSHIRAALRAIGGEA